MLSVNDQFNALLSCRRFREIETCQELHRLFEDHATLGALEWCKLTGISGLTVARVSGDPHQFIAQLATVVKQIPWTIEQLLKAEPIDVVVETNAEAIRTASQKLAQRMPKKAKFRVNLNRRIAKVDRDKIIREVATQFPGKVDLDDYEWICAVEVLGPVTGLALLRKEEILTLRLP
jgi:tRNA(Ser,Leu) C12 N-acetylase TAN1